MNAFNLQPGTVVAIDTSYGVVPVRHFGVLSDRTDQHGVPFVFNASQRSGHTLEEHWNVFLDGRQGFRVDLWGGLHSHQVVARARQKLGLPWDLLSWNCEHYIRWCHGLEPESPQVQAGVGIALRTAAIIGIGVALARG
ncbi:MAG: hypothetical protein ACOZNI_16255 [Myxococcota bacterium]